MAKNKRKNVVKKEHNLIKKGCNQMKENVKPEENFSFSDKDDDSDDFSLRNPFVAAIIQNKPKLMNHQPKTNTLRKERIRFRSEVPQSLSGFKTVKGANKKAAANSIQPDKYERIAYELILKNEKLLAIEYLNTAIELNVADDRHYINRSYCLLETGDYDQCLNDVNRVILHSSDNLHRLAHMNFRKAQIFWRKEAYDMAEFFFKESLSFVPNSMTTKCEYFRMKIDELKSLGFHERDILEIYEEDLAVSIKDAVTILCEVPGRMVGRNYLEDGEVDDEIYVSDTEEDLSNEKLFMNLINFSFDDSYDEEDVQMNTEVFEKKRNLRIKNATQPNPNDKKSLEKNGTTTPRKKAVESTTLWVKSFDVVITKSALKKKFSQYGRILHIHQSRDEKHSFIKFANANSVAKAVAERYANIAGHDVVLSFYKK